MKDTLHKAAGRRSLPVNTILIAFALTTSFTANAQVPDTLMAVRDSSNTTMLSLHKNGGFFIAGNFDGITNGNIPVEGAGARMMWHPQRAAFRTGYVNGTQWDDVNVGFYSFAAGDRVRASAQGAVAMGTECWAGQLSSFAVGENNTATGASSVALGYHSHTNARTGSFVFGDRSTVDTVRAGVNHSATWRVSGGFRLFTSSNLSTGMTFQSGATVSNWGQSDAVISTSTGAYLSTAGVWTNLSDVNRKHLFEQISYEDILLKLRNLPVNKWSYKNDNNRFRHIGPMAQDFYKAFGLGNDDRSIGTVDADGIALAAIKGLETRTTHLAEQIEILKAENAALRNRLDAKDKPSGMSLAGFPLIAIIGGLGLIGLLLHRRRAAATGKE